MGSLEFMEKLIELFQRQFGIHTLLFIALVQELQLQMHETLAIVLDHRVSSCHLEKGVMAKETYMRI